MNEYFLFGGKKYNIPHWKGIIYDKETKLFNKSMILYIDSKFVLYELQRGKF